MGGDWTFRIATLFVIGIGKGIRGYYQKKVARESFKQLLSVNRADTLVALIVMLGWESTLGLYLIYPRALEWARLPFPEWLRWGGVLLGLAALPFFVWTHRVLGDNFSLSVRVRDEHTLVTDGPYQWIRHPTYTYGLLTAIAMFLITANWFTGLMWIGGGLLMFGHRIPREEAGLIDKFGDQYRRYMRRTGRLLPKLIR